MDKFPHQFVLIIGAMKSGTTSLFDILGQHPQICPAKIKEPGYFAHDSDEKGRYKYLELWDWQNSTYKYAIESSVMYTKAPFITGVPQRISNSGLGDFRFIYMLREPLSRIESQVRHGLFAGWGKSLDEGITEDLIEFSRYAMQIDNYLEFFPRDKIILITLEEFKLNPHAVLGRICDFLGLDKNFQFENVEKPRNSGDFFNTPSIVARVTQGKIGQYFAQKILPAKMKNWLRDIITHVGNRSNTTSVSGRWKLNEDERRLILDRLAGDLARLESEFGVDVCKYWNIPSELLDNKK